MHCTARRRFASFLTLMALLTVSSLAYAQSEPTILHAAEASKLLPDTVYYAGKSANTQLRNSAGIKFPDGHYTFAVLVDTSGYSSTVQEKYQGYLLTEVPLKIGDHRLPAGAYGFGFVSGHFGVMDIGNHDVLQAPASHNQALPRPLPLQILPGSSGGFRLCDGRECVGFQAAK